MTKTVSSLDLHKKSGSKTEHCKWMAKVIDDFGLFEGKDYEKSYLRVGKYSRKVEYLVDEDLAGIIVRLSTKDN